MATILTKKKDTSGAPSAGDLTNDTGGAELAVNTADKRLYTKDSGGNVVEVGINPTSITTGTLNTSGAVVFNDAGADVDFRVEGDTDANLLFVDASADKVGIGTSTPSLRLEVGGSFGGMAISNTTTTAGTTNLQQSYSGGSAELRIGSNTSGSDVAAILVKSGDAGNTIFNGNVGIGTGSPSVPLGVSSTVGSGNTVLGVSGGTDSGLIAVGSSNTNGNAGSQTWVGSGDSYAAALTFGQVQASGSKNQIRTHAAIYSTNIQSYGRADLAFATKGSLDDNDPTERMRINSSGNVGIGTSSPAATLDIERTTGVVNLQLQSRDSSDTKIEFGDNDDSDIGIITYAHSDNSMRFTTNTAERMRIDSSGNILPGVDNAQDLGSLTKRYDDVYATNGTIQTSDANEKQDIEALSEAETRVAVAAKNLMKKYRWKSAVAEKGDDARIHFGIIAQDLKAAFEAEGLDAGRYAMFIHSAWWEHEVEVPAVEAKEAVYETQTDEEGNEVQVLVSEAVEGKDAYTRTDTYETEAEAPEGAVRKERMGIRYNELLAFIIAAL